MVLVDTTVLIDYLRGATNPQTDCSIENLTGNASAKPISSFRLEVFRSGGVDLASVSTRNYRALRVKGCTVRKTIHCLIASFCLAAGHSLVHRDRAFDHSTATSDCS